MTGKNYFQSNYQPCAYSPGWYGTLDYAPPATILLYNDNSCVCIGYMEDALPPGVMPITEQQANEIFSNAVDIDGVWFGEKLLHRWDVTEDGG